MCSNSIIYDFRLAQRVSELLDSFKPGTISYRPFKKQARGQFDLIDNNNNNNNDNNNHGENLEDHDLERVRSSVLNFSVLLSILYGHYLG